MDNLSLIRRPVLLWLNIHLFCHLLQLKICLAQMIITYSPSLPLNFSCVNLFHIAASNCQMWIQSFPRGKDQWQVLVITIKPPMALATSPWISSFLSCVSALKTHPSGFLTMICTLLLLDLQFQRFLLKCPQLVPSLFAQTWLWSRNLLWKY